MQRATLLQVRLSNVCEYSPAPPLPHDDGGFRKVPFYPPFPHTRLSQQHTMRSSESFAGKERFKTRLTVKC